MPRERLSRRAMLIALGSAPIASALDRHPTTGRVRISIPFGLSDMDPHDLHDPISALFGHAVFDTLFARNNRYPAYPALAAALPEIAGNHIRVALRPDLRTSRGTPLDAEDVAWSLERARRGAAAGLLAPFAPFEAVGKGAIRMKPGDPAGAARALSSPAAAILSKSHHRPTHPVATGAFRAAFGNGQLVLRRNDYAARGAPYLETVEINPARDLAEALRAFEVGDSDIGWLGAGLHGRRKNAVTLAGPVIGWVVLRTGPEAGAFGAPGIAQNLLEGLPTNQLAALGLDGGPRRDRARSTWRGPTSDLLVDRSSPYLVEVARTVSALLGAPGHELVVREISPADLRKRRREGRYALLVDWVSSIGQRGAEPETALLTAADPRLASHPPAGGGRSADAVARALPLGVVGRVSVSGAVAPTVRNLTSWSLPDAYKPRSG